MKPASTGPVTVLSTRACPFCDCEALETLPRDGARYCPLCGLAFRLHGPGRPELWSTQHASVRTSTSGLARGGRPRIS